MGDEPLLAGLDLQLDDRGGMVVRVAIHVERQAVRVGLAHAEHFVVFADSFEARRERARQRSFFGMVVSFVGGQRRGGEQGQEEGRTTQCRAQGE